jgi:hypothetical protein
MALGNDTTLGRELLNALEAVNGLILKPASPQDRENLSHTRARLIEQIGALVDTNLNRANQDYQRATSSLQAASGLIRRAISDMESVAQAVETLARALDLVTRLIAA